jgi:hypothetical protein
VTPGNLRQWGIAYLSLDAPQTLRLARENPEAFVRSEPRMIIDEVQREPDLILAIKSVVDRQRPAVRGQFVITGSMTLPARDDESRRSEAEHDLLRHRHHSVPKETDSLHRSPWSSPHLDRTQSPE